MSLSSSRSPVSSPSSSDTTSTSTTTLARRIRRLKPPPPRMPSSSLMLLATVLLLFTAPARSVLINSFKNCMDENVITSPDHLQFHPLVVAAAFGTQETDLLQLTVWGNVTGENIIVPARARRDVTSGGRYRPRRTNSWAWWQKRQSEKGADTSRGNANGTTEMPGTLNWGQLKVRNPTVDNGVQYKTTGTIVYQQPEWGRNLATTLRTDVMVASFQVFSNRSFLCEDPGGRLKERSNAACPMGNVFLTTADAHNLTTLVDKLPSFTWEHRLDSGYSFASIDTTFRIFAGDAHKTLIGCISVETTPYLGKANDAAITWVPAGILALVALSTVLAAMLNPWVGTTDIFRWSSNYGMDGDMIRLVTPGFADCLQWLQFFVFTGSLSLSYPGFYQPVVSKVAWSALLFNTSFFSHDPVSQQKWMGDGIYALDAGAFGLERVAQAVGLQFVDDIWACTMAFFAVVALSTVVMPQLWFTTRWAVRAVLGTEEGDLTNKNLPFTVGMLNRITFTYFLTPILAVSAFMLTAAGRASNTIVSLAGALIFVVIGIAVYLTIRIWNHKPRSTLFDNLPTLLTFGTFYNTYREKNLKFFIVQLYVNIARALAFGALQPSGIAQITILAICEIVLVLTVGGIKPYAPATSMNAWQAIISLVRLLTILLMMAFVPSMDATDAAKCWIGYVILVIHALVMVFGFFFMAVQTLLELFIRGCGGADEGEAARGGLAKVFGVRQLSRRKHKQHRNSVGPGIIDVSTHSDHKMSTSNTRPAGVSPMSRSGSSAVLLGGPAVSTGASGMMEVGNQSIHHHSGSGSTGFTPTTPGAMSNFSYLGPPGPPLSLDTGVNATAGPYYRQPRVKGGTYGPRNPGEGSGSDNYSPGARSRGSWTSEAWGAGAGAPSGRRGSSQGSLPHGPDDIWPPSGGGAYPEGAGRGGPAEQLAHRLTDNSFTAGSIRNTAQKKYEEREGDFYYGVRGPALSDQPGRRLGTGPADPTGPVAVAKGWFWKRLGFRGKKESGFTVVRSSRAPEELLDAERQAKGIGMAVTSPTPVAPDHGHDTDSDGSEDDSGDEGAGRSRGLRQQIPRTISQDSDSDNDSGAEDDVNIALTAPGPSARMLEKQPAFDGADGGIELRRQDSIKPRVPRKSSKRKSASLLAPVLTDPQPQSHSPPSNPLQARLPHYPYDLPPPRMQEPARHQHYDRNLSPGRLPFTREGQESTHSRSISASSSILPPPPEITLDDDPLSRPPSVGKVHRYRMEDSMRNSASGDVIGSSAELVESGSAATTRNGSLVEGWRRE